MRKKHPERGKEKLGSFEGTLPRFFYSEWSVFSFQWSVFSGQWSVVSHEYLRLNALSRLKRRVAEFVRILASSPDIGGNP